MSKTTAQIRLTSDPFCSNFTNKPESDESFYNDILENNFLIILRSLNDTIYHNYNEPFFPTRLEGQTWLFTSYTSINRMFPRIIKWKDDDIIEKLQSFLELESDWDSNGANKISKTSVEYAKEIYNWVLSNYSDAPRPFVCPFPDGRVSFTFKRTVSSIRIVIKNEEKDYYFIEMDKSDDFEGNTVKNMQEVKKVFSDWIKSNSYAYGY